MLITHHLKLPVLCSFLLIAACGQNSEPTTAKTATTETTSETATTETAAPATASENAVATVNGKPITQESYDSFMAETGTNANINREQVINELIARELIIQDALAKKIDQREDVTKRLAQLKRDLLLQSALRDVVMENPVSDEELKKEYDELIAKNKAKEYKARHILVEEEDKAKALIVELDGGADFAELAKANSTGPSGKNGGDLGWFGAGQMVPPFEKAVQSMEKGQYSKEPVKTQFGWHIILLEDIREMTPPAFEDVKQQIQQMVQQRRIGDYIEQLKAKAKIEIK